MIKHSIHIKPNGLDFDILYGDYGAFQLTFDELLATVARLMIADHLGYLTELIICTNCNKHSAGIYCHNCRHRLPLD